MSDLASERLAELRRIAEAATPGPWDATRYNSGLRFDGPLRVYAGTDPEYGEPRPIPATDADTRYIAAFDPPTVLALLDEIERLHGQLRLATVDQAIVEAEANDARAEALKERIYALEADLDTAQHADHEETIRALVVAADRLAALEALESADWYIGQLELLVYSPDDTGTHEDRAKVQSAIAALRERLGEGAEP